jgi:uncharacterized protein (TIGR03083 family)
MSDEWNPMNPAAKGNLLGVLRREAEEFLATAGEAGSWESPTFCTNWQVRDVVAHLIDSTEGYFPGWEMARGGGGEAPEPLGLRGMLDRNDERARAMRNLSQKEVVERLRADLERAMGFYESLTDEDWGGLMCFHPSMGPLPAFFYPTFQLADYGVHNWDLREGLGRHRGLPGDTADLLSPIMFILWQATADTDSLSQPLGLGVRLSGPNGGTWRLAASKEGVTVEPGDVGDLPLVIDFDPADLVLTAYGRIRGGTERGDTDIANRFYSLIYPI